MFLDLAMIALSVAFMALFANIQISNDITILNWKIPLGPVPITMQTFGVFTLAFWFGSRKGAIALATYALVGAVGIGVFAKFGSGMGVFISLQEGAIRFGPTGGYIIGFILAAFVVGYLIERGYGRTFLSVCICILIGEIIIYAIGLPWLWLALPDSTLIQILVWGLFPFIIGHTLKALAAAGLFPFFWKGAEKLVNNH